MAINWDKVKKQAEEQEKTGRTTRGKGVYNNNAAAAPKRDAGVPAIADAPADVYGGVFDVNPDSFATEATGKAKPSAARNAVLSGLAGTGSSLSKNTGLLLGGMAQGREDAAEHITTPAWLTKGSIYANRGYDPMNPERSEQETRNLQAASSLANEMARDLRAKEQMLDAQAKENLGAVGTAAYDLTKMGTQIVGDAVANRLLPGAGLLSMGQRSFGQGVMAAEDEGITGTRAIAYGAGTAAIEMATEKISAIAKPLKAIYGKGLVDDMIQNLTKTAKGNRVLSVLGSAAGEGAEEAIASVLQVPLQNITLQNGAAYDAQWLADTAYEALLGGLMGGAFGVASIPGEIAQERRNNAVQQLAEEMARESMQNATQSATAPMQTAEQAHMPAENKMAQRAIQTAKAASVEDAASQFGEAGAQVYKAGYRDTGDDAQYFGDFYKAYQAGMRGEAAPKSSLTDTETAVAHAAGVSDARRSAQATYFGKDSQLVRDDKWKRAHLSTKDSRKLDALAKVLGVKIRFVDSIDETVQNELGETEIRKSVANAQYSNGEILLALDAENPVMVSVVHEAVHRLRETNPAEYASLVQFVQNNMSSGALNWAVKSRREDYKGADRTELTEEVVADAFGQLINDTALLDQFVKDNRTAAEKLLDSIRDMINAIKRALNKQNLQLTENQKAEFQELYDNLYEAEKLLGNALNVSAENVSGKEAQKNTTGDGGVSQDGFAGGKKNSAKKKSPVESDDYTTEQIDWAIDSGVITQKNKTDLVRAIDNEIHRGYSIPKDKDGNYIVESGNVMMFTNGDRHNPSLNMVIILDDEYETFMATAKEVIYHEAQRGNVHAAEQIIEGVYGTGYASFYNAEAYRANGKNVGRGERGIRKGSSPTIGARGNRLSVKDRIYLEAVESGDLETAQKMVDEAAEANGYTIKAYHGSRADFFTFDKDRVGKGNDQYGAGFYFASDREAATHYGNRVIDSVLKLENPYTISSTNMLDAEITLTDEQAYEIVKRHPMMYDPEESPLGDYYDSYWENGVEEWMIEDLAMQYTDLGYLDSDLFRYYPNELHEAIRDVTGHDGIVVNLANGEKFYVAWFDNQMKSTDPVTYDDDGNVIPLSERFNSEKNDIRYSRKGMSIEERIEKYGPIPAGEKPYREVSVPRKTGEKENVSQTVRTVMEAEATPDEMIHTIEELVAEGEFSYESYSDKGAKAGATRTIKSKGFETALADWLSEVKQGKVSKRNTALGWALYNNCANSGDTKSAMTILTAMVEHQRSAAQALQATRILKKMSPTGQLYGAVKIVQKMEDDLNDGKTVDGEAAKRAAGAVGKAKQDAASAAANAHSGVKAKTRGKRIVIDSNMAGEPFAFEYAQKVGEALAKGLEAKRNRAAKEKTFLQHIVAELNRFASEKLPKEQKGASLTAVDLLRDYIQNQAFYAEAWQAAQIKLREKYANDPILSEFINSGIGVDANTNPQNAIFMRALVKAAADSGEGKAVLRRQEALGFTGMANTIADNLIRQTGATGEMADTIRDAAHAYVYDTVNETNGDVGNIVESAIRSAMKDIGVKLADVVMSGTGETVQRDIVENLVGKYGFGMAEATHTAEVVAERFSQMSKQYAENRLRAMFKPRNNVRKTLPEKLEQLGRLGAFDVGSAYNQQAAERLFKSRTPLTISKYLVDKFMDAKTQKERDEIMTEIYKDIGRQMPNSFMDKWRAWRYLAMLGNPRTHVRNIVGNAGFAPMVWTKDLVATGIEAVAGKASGGKMGRTKALPSAELISAAAADFPNAQKKILEGGKYNESEINDAIEEGRVIFKTRVLEKARVGNRKLMEQEDLWFSKGHYAIALAQYCKANSISAQHIRSGKLSDHARAYAIKEAQKATYRDTNAFSEFVSNMGRYHGDNPVGKAGSLLVEGVLPFRKTPANILVRGLEYSPAGFLKGLTWDLWMVRKHAKNPDEGITAAEAIDHISAGFVGTQLVALGAFGAMMGVLRGSGGDDEDQKKFDELQGHQAYSLELEAIDTSVTLDWLAPEVLPLFIGVNIAEEAMRSKEDLTMSDLMAAIGNVTAPMLTMSCLSGLNELFESVSYATNEGIAALPKIAMSASTSLITQAIPTLAGQIERTAQENGRMTTYTDKNNRWLTPDMQYSIGRASSRTPGWDFNQIPYIDAWGRQEVDTNRWARGLNNFLNPAYVSKIEGGAMEEELQRLYDATGEAKVLPDRAAKYFTLNEKRKDLTAQEYVKYATAKGQKSYELVSKLIANRSWKSLSDAEKVEAIAKAYEYANAVAKTKVSPYKLEGANAKIRNSGNDTLYIMAWAAQTDVDNGLKRDGETISNSKSLLQMEAMYALPAIANMDANKRKELFLSIGVGKTVAGYSKDTVKSELGKMRKTAD